MMKKKVEKIVGQGPTASYAVATDRYHVKLTFTNDVLGSQPGRNDPASKFLRDRIRDEHPEITIPPEEVESLPTEATKGTTCFFRIDNRVAFRSYQILGMIKAAASALNGVGGAANIRSKVISAVRVEPCVIDTGVAESELTMLERPLRCQTMQGPRVTLARSEQLASGTAIEFDVSVMQLPKFPFPEELLRALLDYASIQLGMGQWVNSGIYGKFSYVMNKNKA